MLRFPLLDEIDRQQEVGLSRASAEQSITQALAMKASTGIVSTVLSGWSCR